MENQKLPNVTVAIILSIIGYVCCCIWGVPAIVLGVIGLLLLQSDLKKYRENPELYSNFGTWKTARILCIVSIAIGAIYLSFVIFQIMRMGGWEAYYEQTEMLMDQWGIE
jgi:ABC-type phosphate transport system permease subunit